MNALRWVLAAVTATVTVGFLVLLAWADGFRRSFGASANGPLVAGAPLGAMLVVLASLLLPGSRPLLHVTAAAVLALAASSAWLLREAPFLGGTGLLFSALWSLWYWHAAWAAPGTPASKGAGAGCGVAFRVEARLEQLSERSPDYEVSRLDVVLRDPHGREVETPGVELDLDGVALTYAVSQGNFYDRHPSYRLREDDRFRFAPDTSYTLNLRRAGESPLRLAELRTPGAFSPATFQVPASHPGGDDLVLSWKGLPQPAELLVYRTLATLDEQGNTTVLEGGPYGDDVLRRRIGSRGLSLPDGSTVVPASYLRGEQGRVVTSVTLEVTATNEGSFLCAPLEPSEASASRKVVLRVDVTPDAGR